MKVNFVDLRAQYLPIKDEIDEAIQNVVDSSAFSSGPFVKSFEKNFAHAHNAKCCLGVNSGTSALHITLWALGIGPDDEVIVPTNTFFATPEAVSLCGATPVFVDCEPTHFNIDPRKIEQAITTKTKAIIAVHLYGQPAQIDEIQAIALRNNLLLIEDCAQAHLAQYKEQAVGTFGIAGCFSFYPGKNLGAYGEAGAVITNDRGLYQRTLALRDHGSSKKNYHDYVGHNYRMEGIQGAVLDVKLKYLQGWTEKRRNNAALYKKYLAEVEDVELPHEMLEGKHVYHLFVIGVPRRDELMKYLAQREIYTGIHYPIPCHLQKAYRSLRQHQGKLPVSEKRSKKILSLPMYAELTGREIQFVCEQIKSFYQS